MTSFFFKFVFLNSLLSFFASFKPSLGVVDNDGEAALRDIGGSRSNRTHGWQVVGGTAATENNFNFQVLIRVNPDELKNAKTCTGTIISKTIVVTAGNCICNLAVTSCPNYSPNSIRVFAGSIEYSNLKNYNKVKEYYVHLARKHPKFRISRNDLNQYTKFHFDFGVIKIKSLFYFYDRINKITVANNDITHNIKKWEGSHKECEVYGVGTKPDSAYKEYNFALELFYANMKFMEINECLTRWKNKGFEVKAGDHICATGSDKSVCITDNGGGLRCLFEAKWYFVGVATLTENCGSEEVPSVFTRVDAALEFINEHLYENEKSSPSSGDFIHNKFVAQYYCGQLTSIFLLTIVFKIGF